MIRQDAEPIDHQTVYPRIDLYGPKPAEGGVSEIEPYVTTAVADHIWEAVVHTARGTNPPPLTPRIEPASTSESASEESAAPTQPIETVYWVNSEGALVGSDFSGMIYYPFDEWPPSKEIA